METTASAVQALDHSVVPVMDLWRAERFYTEVLDGAIFHKVGMTFETKKTTNPNATFVDPPGAFVKLGRHHLGLFLTQQVPVTAPGSLEGACPCLGIAIAQHDLSQVRERVREWGCELGPEQVERFGDRNWRSVRFTDSEGNCLALIADEDGRYNGHATTGLSHAHFETPDLSRTVAFYGETMGMTVVDRESDHATFSTLQGQCLVFHQVSRLSAASLGPYYGRHFAFTVEPRDFHAIVARLRAAGIPEGDALGRNVPGELDSYFSDPVSEGLWLQIQNKTSEQSAAGHMRLRYAAA